MRVIGSDERVGIGERAGKDGVAVRIGGKGTVGRNGEGAELILQMGDETNACVPGQFGRHQQELSRRISKTLEMPGQQ